MKVFLVLFSLFAASGLGAQTSGTSGAWAAALPRADRSAAQRLLDASDAVRTLYIGDRAAAAESQERYAYKAYLAAARLEAGGGAALNDGAVLELHKLRRLRWESAKDLSGEGYRKSPGGDGEVLARSGRALRDFLAPRIAKLGVAQLRPMEAQLASRMAEHPDTPPLAFASLREAALGLEAAGFRSWVLLLAEGVPRSLAAYELPPETESEFARRLGHFSELYAARMLLRDVFPAAAAAVWYADGAAGYGPVPEFAGASLSSFLTNLSAVDPAYSGEVLIGEGGYGRAFLELSTLLWVFATRMPDHAFTAGLNQEGLDRVFKLFPRAGRGEAQTGRDYAAVVRAERFAVQAEAAVEDGELLAAFGEFRSDHAALEVLGRGERYGPLRDRLSRALAVLSASSSDTLPDVTQSVPVAADDAELPQGELEWAVEAGLIYLRTAAFSDTGPLAADAMEAAFSGAAVRGAGAAESVMLRTARSCAALGIPASCMRIPVAGADMPEEDAEALRLALLSGSSFRLSILLKGGGADDVAAGDTAGGSSGGVDPLPGGLR